MTSITVSPTPKHSLAWPAIGLLGAGLLVAAAAAVILGRPGSGDTDEQSAVAAVIAEHEALISQTLASTETGPSVAELVSRAIVEHSAAFPMEASVVSVAAETTDDIIAAHEAAIAGWLDSVS